MRIKHSIPKTILKGLAVLLPIIVLGWLLYWLAITLEGTLGHLFQFLFPRPFYLPGLGLVLALVVSYVVGLAMNTRPAQRLFDQWKRILARIPLIKTVYGTVQDLVESFSTDKSKQFNRVVMIRWPDSGIRLLGYVTQENLSTLPAGLGTADDILVYVPLSYQLGGHMVVVSRTQVTPLDLSIEDASRLVFTAGMSIGTVSKGEQDEI